MAVSKPEERMNQKNIKVSFIESLSDCHYFSMGFPLPGFETVAYMASVMYAILFDASSGAEYV